MSDNKKKSQQQYNTIMVSLSFINKGYFFKSLLLTISLYSFVQLFNDTEANRRDDFDDFFSNEENNFFDEEFLPSAAPLGMSLIFTDVNL